jgi:hypothetical protein
MGVRIQLLDRSDNPKSKYSIYVKWTDGFCSGQTDSDGVYDTGVENGTIEYIEVYGEKVMGRRAVKNGEIISVKVTRS